MKSEIARFTEKYIPEPNSGCWLWLAAVDKDGYGRFTVADGGNGTSQPAHRVSYRLYVGKIGRRSVLHRCDTPPCVNPQHLFRGTTQDNRQDCVDKNRQATGARNGRSKLTWEQVREIRALPKRKRYVRDAAYKYNVSRQTIIDIRANRLWVKP